MKKKIVIELQIQFHEEFCFNCDYLDLDSCKIFGELRYIRGAGFLRHKKCIKATDGNTNGGCFERVQRKSV